MSKKVDVVTEIATRAAAADYWSFGHYLPNPDPVLKKMGKDIATYREVLADPHVSGCVRRRKAGVKALEWRISESDNSRVNDTLPSLFERLKLSHIISEILDATLYGYQVLEVTWQHRDGLYLPVAITGKPQEWFVFDEENKLRFRTKEHPFDGIEVPDKTFLLARQESSYTNPYGRGDLSLCFWASTFKKGGFKFWLKFTEKYGSPWVIGKHPRSATPTETDDLLNSLEAMIGTAIAAIPNDSSVDIVESAGKGASTDAFGEFLKYCKAEIAIALLGQNQTTEAEANRASATAGLEVTQDIRDADAEIVSETLNQLIAWICEYNFDVDPPQFELYEQEAIDKLQAERDETLAKAGARLSNQYYQRTYDLEDGDLLEQTSPAPASTQPSSDFAESEKDNEPQAIDKMVDQAVEKLGQQTDSWVATIKAELATAESLEAFNAKLDELLSELSIDEYAELLGDAKSAAHLLGRHEVLDKAAPKIAKHNNKGR